MENEIQIVFRFSFSWRNWKTNYRNRSRLILWLLSQVWFTRYSRASSSQVNWGFPLCSGNADTKNMLFRKQLMYFNVYIAGCYFHIWFIFIDNCDKKNTLAEAAIMRCSAKVIPKVIHKCFNRKSWFKI